MKAKKAEAKNIAKAAKAKEKMKVLKTKSTKIRSCAYKISILENEKEIARCFLYLIYNSKHKNPYALLEDVFVASNYRQKGIGSMLLEKAIAEAKKLNCYKIIATSRFENKIAHHLYAKFGFKKWGFEFRRNLL